jgi:isopentenyl-diphosphate Delta-isomerase
VRETIGQRKLDQLETVLHGDVAARHITTGFEAIRFEHNALPELDYSRIDLGTSFVGRKLRAPLLISSMTGGPTRAGRINATLAEIAQAMGLAIAVGSQRIALETNHTAGFDTSLRRVAPDVPILANVGAGQLRGWYETNALQRAVDMIEADALIIHLNPLQEALQQGGDRDWSGILKLIGKAVESLPCPVVVKEVGCGISGNVARRLMSEGVTIIDVAGVGGTSWAAVEAEQAKSTQARGIAETFRDWGVPTAQAIMAVKDACPDMVIIASGGMRNGLDAAKAIRLGASLVGFAAAILTDALEGPDSLQARFEAVVTELRIAAFCTGSATLEDLRKARLQG